ncbi:DnaD domain protein (plasmid) [Latilactobacillus curvatus]|uniref:DnaD domain-containing protein n=1 Tax=Latilactobacillus curvatus TaxID=28038 RepID=UPI0024B97841|nr:DnaD domain protein [Latilactobacillus curvatus]WHQ77643.1 DnaD domain protein [Latilactobacillus curvatus]WHQ79261.1 DnaD domain protein [Latilactobacillus curvatus]
MADESWFKVYRKIKKSFVWSNPYYLKLWLLILSKAKYKPDKFIFNGQEMYLNSGQLVTGRAALTAEMNDGVKPAQLVNSTFVWRTLKKFEKAEMLHIKSTPKYSVVTVLNWDEYQQSEQLVNINRTASEHLNDTYKELKKEKKEKNITTTQEKSDQVDKQQDQKNAVGYWLNKINQAETPIVLEQIQSYVEDLGDEVVILAINMMAVNGARSFAYAKAILNGWLNQTPPLTTMEEITNFERQRKEKKAKTGSNYNRRPQKEEPKPKWTDPDYKAPKEKVTPEQQAELDAMLKKIQESREL